MAAYTAGDLLRELSDTEDDTPVVIRTIDDNIHPLARVVVTASPDGTENWVHLVVAIPALPSPDEIYQMGVESLKQYHPSIYEELRKKGDV